MRHVFNKIFAALAAGGGKPDQLMIDATDLKAHRTAASLLRKGLVVPMIPRIIGPALLPDVFGKLNDWRRIHARYDRCAHAFMTAARRADRLRPAKVRDSTLVHRPRLVAGF
jgi:hypothetical protein